MITTVAPGTTAPLSSFTSPEMEPVGVCPRRAATEKKKAKMPIADRTFLRANDRFRFITNPFLKLVETFARAGEKLTQALLSHLLNS
jgi:hypothetical protein